MRVAITIAAAVLFASSAPCAGAGPQASPPRSSAAQSTAATGQVKKPRRYNIPQPSCFPGATMPFPDLAAFVQGEKRSAYEPGRVYVIEFFSTTCSHCEEAAPLVADLVAQYAPKGFEFISVTTEDEAKVREWLAKPEVAELVTHSVASDPDQSALKALQFGTFQNLNPRFFVLKDGAVLWYGHPDIAADPFARIAGGTWSPESVRAEFVMNAVVAKAKDQTTKLVAECEKNGQWEDAFELFDSIAFTIPEKASTFELQKFGTMIGPARMPVEGYRYGRELALKYATDIASLRTLARTTLAVTTVEVRDLDFAFAVARAADMLGKGEDARAAEVLALAYFSRGDRDNAIAAQERAVRLQTDVKLKAKYESQLAKYRTDDPKPVPALPRKPTGGTATPAVDPL
ncbi:MAG: TlpA disulfide reductase family protein [Planctomycetota bacterium]